MNATISFLVSAAQICWSQGTLQEKGRQNHLPKGTATLTWQVLDINNLWTWHRSDGEGNHSPGGEDGLSYPAFTGRCVYEDNLIFGGIMYVGGWPENGGTKSPLQSIRVNGGTYLSNHGMVQGWVEGSGAAANYTNSTNHPLARIFRIRRDYKQMSQAELQRDAAITNELSSPAQATQAMIGAMVAQYDKDWKEWPVQYGAPYIDRNGNGAYDPPPEFTESFTVDSLRGGGFDEPGISGSTVDHPADQVLYTVFNGLDRSTALKFGGSEPIGLEVQKTVWAYRTNSALSDHYFVSYRFVNTGGIDIGGGQKGTFFIDSLFVSQWADIDLGNAGDDLVGCDTVLHAGYTYNYQANDLSYSKFNLPPPAAGYSILTGPLVASTPSDSGTFCLKRVSGRKNLGMTSFAYRVFTFWEDPWYDYERGTGRMWAMLRGYAPVGTIYDPPVPYPVPPGYSTTVLPLSGDPVTQTGLIDGLGTTYSFGAGDRRMQINSGPSRLAPGDTAELVLVFSAGLGADRLSSIAVLKSNFQKAREAYNHMLDIPRAADPPVVTAAELNNEVVLIWGSDTARVHETEHTLIAGNFRFEGYNVYQLPDRHSAIATGKKITTFDLVDDVTLIIGSEFNLELKQFQPVLLQRGTDSGIRRFLKISKDYLREGDLLHNGVEYYFAITAYNHSPLHYDFPSFESSPAVITVQPRLPFGLALPTSFGDTLDATHASGTSGGNVLPIVIDPTAGTGDTYEVHFDASASPTAWSVVNITKGRTVLSDQTNQTGDEDYLIAEGGVLLKVIGNAAQPNTAADIFRYTVPGTAKTPAANKASIRRMSVFPNPFVLHSGEANPDVVTFTNLPPKAVIRIYNLAGQLVRTLRKDDASQFLRWNLTNEQDWLIASGVYLCHIDMRDIHETKVLKLAVVQQQLPVQ